MKTAKELGIAHFEWDGLAFGTGAPPQKTISVQLPNGAVAHRLVSEDDQLFGRV